jgi:uncharacterized protein YbjT (DUF2867 family)
MKLLLLGATGLVGSSVLAQALSDPTLSLVIAPTRKSLAPRDKLVNPVGLDLEELVPALLSHRPAAVICALGTTQAKAGSKEAFRHVDYELPVAIGTAAQRAGVDTFVIVTAMGASEHSPSFYYRTKGEVERDLRQIGFRSLTICRPSLIGGTRREPRSAEAAALTVLRVLAPLLPKKLHVNPAEVIAAELLNAASAARPGCRWILAEALN